MALRNKLEKQWFWAPEGQSYFLDDDCSEMVFSRMMQEMLESAWVTQSIRLGGRLK